LRIIRPDQRSGALLSGETVDHRVGVKVIMDHRVGVNVTAAELLLLG